MCTKRLFTAVLASVCLITVLFAACGEVTPSTPSDDVSATTSRQNTTVVSSAADTSQNGGDETKGTTETTVENETTENKTTGNGTTQGVTAAPSQDKPTTASRPTGSFAPEKTSQVVITTQPTTKPVTLPPVTTQATVTLPPPPPTTLPPVTTTTVKPTTTTAPPKTALTALDPSNYYGYGYLQKQGGDLAQVYLAIAAAAEVMEETVDISVWSVTPNDLGKVFSAYEADYPQHFWCDHAYGYSTMNGKVVEISLQYSMTPAQRDSARIEFNKAVDAVLADLSGNMSDYEKELRIHDALVNSIDYKASGDPNDYTAYGALVRKKGVCESYARAFQYLCYRAGIQCLLVTGNSMGVGHMWNVVKIDGEWYHMDVTWDDPIGPQNSSLPYYDYFNVSTNEIKRTHGIDAEQLYAIPNCTVENGDYFTRDGLVMGNTFDKDVVVRALVRFAKNGKTMAQVSTTLESKQFTDALMSQFWDIVGAANAQIADPDKQFPTKSASLSFSINEDTGVAHFFIK